MCVGVAIGDGCGLFLSGGGTGLGVLETSGKEAGGVAWGILCVLLTLLLLLLLLLLPLLSVGALRNSNMESSVACCFCPLAVTGLCWLGGGFGVLAS